MLTCIPQGSDHVLTDSRQRQFLKLNWALETVLNVPTTSELPSSERIINIFSLKRYNYYPRTPALKPHSCSNHLYIPSSKTPKASRFPLKVDTCFFVETKAKVNSVKEAKSLLSRFSQSLLVGGAAFKIN